LQRSRWLNETQTRLNQGAKTINTLAQRLVPARAKTYSL